MNQLINIYKTKNRPPFYQIWLSWYISSLLEIICGLIAILTLCFWRPKWNIIWNIYIGEKFAKVIVEKMFIDLQNQAKKYEEKMKKMEEKTLAALEDDKIENNPINNIFS